MVLWRLAAVAALLVVCPAIAMAQSVAVSGTVRAERDKRSETETPGYGLLRVYATYSIQSARAVQTITARLDNATDRLYRSHLNFLKDVVPEMGRQFRLVYAVKF